MSRLFVVLIAVIVIYFAVKAQFDGPHDLDLAKSDDFYRYEQPIVSAPKPVRVRTEEVDESHLFVEPENRAGQRAKVRKSTQFEAMRSQVSELRKVQDGGLEPEPSMRDVDEQAQSLLNPPKVEKPLPKAPAPQARLNLLSPADQVAFETTSQIAQQPTSCANCQSIGIPLIGIQIQFSEKYHRMTDFAGQWQMALEPGAAAVVYVH